MRLFFFFLNIFHSFLNIFALDKDQRNAKKYFSKKVYIPDGRLILVEAWQTPWNQLGLSFFLPAYVKIKGGHPINFYLTQRSNFFQFKQSIRQRFSLAHKCGIRRIVFFGPTKKNFSALKSKATSLLSTIKSPEEFELLTYKGIKIGDLVYDQYLRAAHSPTILLNDPLLLEKLTEAIGYFDELEMFFDTNKVIAVCVSHTVYNLAIPARIAVDRGADVFQVTGESIYRLNKNFSHAYTDFKTYKREFENLPESQREKGLVEARNRLEKRLNGIAGVDMIYSTRSAYAKSSDSELVLKGNNPVKILVAIHDFYDSPHAYGNNLFPDFKIWLDFLGSVSKDTKYNWYLKTHPDVIGSGETIIQNFASINPEFQVVPKEVSHHTLIKNGINVVLTIFGTISAEYAYLGKLSVNASINNPHVNYEFSLTPNSVDEYRKILLDLENILKSFSPKRKDILEFYFMHNIRKLKSWTIKDVFEASTNLGGYTNLCSWKVFPYFFNEKNSFEKSEINNALENFLKSDSQLIKNEHFDMSKKLEK